jgi:hypothetical protein
VDILVMNHTFNPIRKLILHLPGLSPENWWVEVTTSQPACLYYFGPFASLKEAVEMRPGYIDDLVAEGAENIISAIKQCWPKELTQWEEDNSEVLAGHY